MAIPSLNPSACIGKPVQIYALIDPRNRAPFYVGATTRPLGKRLSGHLNDALHLRSLGRRFDVMRDINQAGGRPKIVNLETADSGDWAEAEQFWIGYLRFVGAALTNNGIGGPGALGTRQTSVTRQRRKDAATGRDMSHLRLPEVLERARKPLRHPVEINGIVYESLSAAGRALDVAGETIRFWIDNGRAKRLVKSKSTKSLKNRGLARGERHHASRPILYGEKRYVSARAAAAERGIALSTIRKHMKRGICRYEDGAPPRPVGFGRNH